MQAGHNEARGGSFSGSRYVEHHLPLNSRCLPLPPCRPEFVLPAPPASASVKLSEPTSELAATLNAGLPTVNLDNFIEPQTPAAVCAQLHAASWMPAEMSAYAFSKAQFSRAALKASFEHDNLGEDGARLSAGQPLPDAPSYVPLTTRTEVRLVRAQHTFGGHGLQHHGRCADLASLGRLSDIWWRYGRLWPARGCFDRGRRGRFVLQRLSSHPLPSGPAILPFASDPHCRPPGRCCQPGDDWPQ